MYGEIYNDSSDEDFSAYDPDNDDTLLGKSAYENFNYK